MDINPNYFDYYYFPKVKNASVIRCDSSGNADDNGTYMKISATRSYCDPYYTSPGTAIDNSCEIRYRYRQLPNGTYSAWVTILAPNNLTSDSVSTGALIGTLSADENYEVTVGVKDNVSESNTTVVLPSGGVFLHKDGEKNSISIGEKVIDSNKVSIAEKLSVAIKGLLNVKKIVCKESVTLGKSVLGKNSIAVYGTDQTANAEVRVQHAKGGSIKAVVTPTEKGNASFLEIKPFSGGGSMQIGFMDGNPAIYGLSPNPSDSAEAASKAYVDSGLAGKLDTSATAANSDKLDGYHIDATWGCSAHVIDVSSYDSTYYYPLLIPIPHWIKTRLALIVSLDTNVPSWATHPSGFSCNIDVSLTRSGWGAQTCNYTKWHDDWRLADKKPAWFGGFVYTSNLAVFYVRGGGIYRMYSDDRDIPQPTIVNPSYTDPSGTIYVPVTSQVDYWIGNNFGLDTIETNIKGDVEGNATYAPNSSQLFSSDPNYAYDGIAPYYGHLTYESPYWRFKVYPESPANVIVARSDSSAYADRTGSVDTVVGVYTGGGGMQPPSYVGSNVVRFNMMCNPSGLPAHEYCDYLLMDTYEGGDVPYVTAIGVAKTSVPKAYIAVGQKGNTSTWIEEAEIITTKNACCFDSGSVSTTYLRDSGSGANFYVVHVYVSGVGYTSLVIDKADMITTTYRYYYVHGGGYIGAYRSSNTVTFTTDGSSPATTINHIRGYI